MLNKLAVSLIIFLLLSSCTPQVQQDSIDLNVTADGIRRNLTLPAGSSVQQALVSTGISLSQTDRVTPPAYTIVTEGMTIEVTRVREDFETQQVIIPYERQELRNESLPTGETRLVQAGQNGMKEITIRHVFEDGTEVSNSVVSENTLKTPIAEIVMIGVQSPFAPIEIPGKLAYLTGGNAWIMDGSTFNRRPLVTTGDLDGYIFSLSPDGKLLLFSRKSALPIDQQINTLWVIYTTTQNPTPISLGIANIIHFAAWQPGTNYLIAYSTVEPRSTAPGWQANNDLHFLTLINGVPRKTSDVLETNSGGIYGWWGMTFAWSPDGHSLAYSRPDSIGLVDISSGKLTQLLGITPLNTHGDWAWIPGLAWGSDDKSIYLVNHAAPNGLVSPEESPNFDLLASSLSGTLPPILIQQTGMFAYPSSSSLLESSNGSTYAIAFWQAIFPTQSKTSRYQLMVMNSDGKNLHVLFPAEGQTGLEPRIPPIWAPHPLEGGVDFIGVLYEGNLWIVDAVSGLSQQVTGDGSTSQLDWK
jgi:hypothetical protein